MSTVDRRLKAVTVKYVLNGKFKTVQLVECDRIDIKFYDEDNKLVHIETGEIIKIGQEDEMPYFILVPYDIYLEKSIYNVPINKIYDIININRGPIYSISPVYSSDESVAALRRNGECLEFTTNGKDWFQCGGGSGSDITIDDVDREIDSKLGTYDHVVNDKISNAIEPLASTDYVDTKAEEINDKFDNYNTKDEVALAIEAATADLAPKNNPTFTGNVSVPTPSSESADNTAASTAYVTSKINDIKQELAGALHFKGVVDTYEDLIAIENPEEGDVWQVRTSPAGEDAEYAWAGSINNWVELGTAIDLSAYETKAEATAAIEAAITSANTYTDNKIEENDIYNLVVTKGYTGSKDQFAEALAELANNISTIATIIDET